MKQNVGTVDKTIRLILGLALVALFFLLEGPLRWVGLAGVVLIPTALVNWCPILAVLGLSTRKRG